MSMRVASLLGVLQKDDGNSLYQHLCETLSRLHETDDPLAAFELLSKYVRDGRFPGLRPADIDVLEEDPLAAKREEHGGKLRGLEQLPAACRMGDVPDFWEQSRMLRLAGLGFSDAESYALSLSLRKLAYTRSDCKTVRFWGKVLGVEKDYYVVELALHEADSHNRATTPEQKVLEEIKEDYVEPRGAGTNMYVYMVCSELTEEWVQLPNAVPEKIVVSRQINRLLTGRLDAPVWSHPAFPWPEKDLLRSMISRVSHSTILAPEGWFGPGESEENPDALVEVNPPPSLVELDLVDPANWKHSRPYLRINGRTSWPNTDLLEDESLAGLKADIENQKEMDWVPADSILGAISAEADVLNEMKGAAGLPEGIAEHDGPTGQWIIRKLGDQGKYDFPAYEGQDARVLSYAVTVVESLRFPGAYAVSQGNKFTNIYVGNLVKKQRAFLPLGIPALNYEEKRVKSYSKKEVGGATWYERSKECNFELAPGPVQDEPADTPELIEREDEEGFQFRDEEGAGDEEEDDALAAGQA